MTLAPVFEPRSIAIVGASASPSKRGHQILRALADSGYAGRIHAVNPAGGTILGHEVHRSVAHLPESVDLAVLCTPAPTAPELVRACGRRGVRAAIVLAVGFGESGDEGRQLEDRLRDVARAGGVRVVGPNTSGLLNLPLGVNLIGARGVRSAPAAGGLSVLVQSGNIALDLMTRITRDTGLGVAVCCGLGNEVDVGFGEVLEFLGDHGPTRAVIVHVEGCRDGRALLRAVARVAPRKPVIVIKSGRTAAGARAALSHTGAVAGPYERLSAGLAQAGAVEVKRTDELLHVAAALARQGGRGVRAHDPDRGRPLPGASAAARSGPPGSREEPRGSRSRLRPGIAILSDGGGQNTLAVDALHEMGAGMARLSGATRAALRDHLGPAAAVRNPVDVAGAADADPSVFGRALEVMAADPGAGVLFLVGLFGGYGLRFSAAHAPVEVEAARSMAAAARARGKGLVVHSQYAAHPSSALDLLRAEGVPVIESLEAACRAAGELQLRAQRLAAGRWWDPGGDGVRPSPGNADDGAAAASRSNAAAEIIAAARREGRLTLSETESRSVLAAAGLPFGPMKVARTPAEAARAAAEIGGPVAVKLLSGWITHKSDAGGVALGVTGARAARDAFARIVAGAKAHAAAHGLPREAYAATIAPMLDPPLAELLVGAHRDPGIGPVLTVGAGGVWVEVLRDVAHRVLPVGPREVEAALDELRMRALLEGARGRPAVNAGRVVDAALAVARCLLGHPEIAEVEVNPLFVYLDRVAPVDARVVLTALPREKQ